MGDKPREPSSDVETSALANLAVDRAAEVPIGVQLGWTLCSLISDGSFLAGQQLPTLREMAQASGLNVNTIRVVYQRLEQKGLIESQQGSGTFVAASSARPPAVGSIAATAASSAREKGVDPRAVAAALYVAPQPPPVSSEQAAKLSAVGHRRTLREQIATLERTVVELEAEYPGVAPAAARSRRGFGPALLTADELARVRTALIHRLTIVQGAIDEHADRQRRARAGASAAQERARRAAKRAPAKAKAKPKAQKPAASTPAPRARVTPRPAPAGG
ncbi:MAG TPA: winged helix-turn-helix domain-containing protein [Solirubrobacteraceae bacterium]|jgi:DNA-binding transcriptional regulator YhcF (GntR family)|nr:winged helix-turn-helix domain-containing protein [Solirubrobacteraceae bacterium]